MVQVINRVIDLLTDLEENEFYGKIEIKFENGKIVLIRKEETIKFGLS